MKKAFTLIEVNLAMFVMAVGVLSVIALYPLGFREAEQSREDVAAAAYCEAVMNSLAAALSATNLPWSKWQKVANNQNTYPSDGWREYFDNSPYPFAKPKSFNAMITTASKAFNSVLGDTGANDVGIAYGYNGKDKVGWLKPPDGLTCGLVVAFTGTRCAIAARATRRPAMLLAQPLFFTEVNFQGDMDK